MRNSNTCRLYKVLIKDDDDITILMMKHNTAATSILVFNG